MGESESDRIMEKTCSDRLQALSDAVDAQQEALSGLTDLVELQGEVIVALIEGLKSPLAEVSSSATGAGAESAVRAGPPSRPR
jgi:hypothetical protein